MRKYIISMMLFMSACLITMSCGDEHVFFPEISTATGAQVKFIHAGTDATGVGFFVDDAAVSSTVTYGNSFPVTGYSVAVAGSLSIDAIVPANDVDPAETLSSGTVNATEGANYTVALLGTSPNYEVAVITDDLSGADIASGKSYIRLVNFIQNTANGVKLEMTPTGGALFTPATNITYKTGSAFIEVEPGTYSSITVKDAVDGTSFGSAASSIRTLTPNKVYTFFGKGAVGGSTSLSRAINR